MTLTPSPKLRARRRLPSTALSAAIAATLFAVPLLARHPRSAIGTWAWAGVAFAITFVVGHLRTVGITPPEVRWDHDGLVVLGDGESASVSWADYGGYRLTWDLPRALKVYRASHWEPVEIDITGFDDDQRALLVRQLETHPIALASQRLDPSRRRIKE